MATRRYFDIPDSYDRDRSSDIRRMRLIPGSSILAIALAITMRVIYGYRVCPVLPVGDAGELATAAYTGGVAHPPGYPLFTILGRIFSHLSFHSPDRAFPDGTFDVAFRMNMLSVWLGVLTVLVLYFILVRALKNPIIAFIGAFIFGTSTTFLSQCLVGEVYTLNALITALIIYVLLLIDEKPTSWRMIILALLFGLGIAHHTSVLFMLLPVLFFLAITFKAKRIFIRKNMLIGMAIFFVLGLLPYLYLPSASAKDPYLDWGNPQSFVNFVKVVTRSEYRDIKSSIPWTDESLGFRGIAGAYRAWQKDSFGILFVILGSIGLLICIFKAKRFGLMLGLFYFFMTVPYFMYFGNITKTDLFYMEVYYIPAHLVFAIFISYAFAQAIEKIPRISKLGVHRLGLGLLIFVALIILTGRFYASNGAKVSMKEHSIGSRYSYDVLNALPQNAVLITGEDEVFLFWYLQQVANVRPDVVVLEALSLTLTNSWWWNSIKKEYPDLNVPELSVPTEPIAGNQFLVFLRQLNPGRKFYLTAFYEEFLPAPAGTTFIPDGVLFAFDSTSAFKSSITLDTPLAQNLFTGKNDFATENLDPYERQILEKYIYAYYNYGNYFSKAKQSNQAREMLTRSFLLDPGFNPQGTHLPTAGILARSYLREGDWVSTHEVLSKLIKRGGADSVWYYLDAYSLIKLTKYDDARIVVLEGLKKDKSNQFLQSQLQYLSNPVENPAVPGTPPQDNMGD
jgi:4-amino-4-deoxy-L-arabinose transferase-like glycosyltransferase